MSRARDFTRRRIYGFPRLTNRHRPAFPSAFFCRTRRGMGGLSAFSAGSLELLRRSHERERGSLSLPATPLPRARVHYDFMPAARRRETKEGVKGACHCAGNRLWKIMGHRVAEGLAKRFYPAFKRGQQMPWHVRSTDASRRAGVYPPTRCDTAGDSDSEICISEPRKMITGLYYRIIIVERTAAGKLSSRADALHYYLSRTYARNRRVISHTIKHE